jgi:hypothetical protein
MAGVSSGFLECLSCISDFLTKDEEYVKPIADEVVKGQVSHSFGSDDNLDTLEALP